MTYVPSNLSDLPVTVDGAGLHITATDGSVQNYTPSSIIPKQGGGTFSQVHQGSQLPNLKLSIDAALPASTNALVGTTPGIQLDINGDVLALTDPVGGQTLTHGYGMVRLISGGPGGFPKFHGSALSTNNAYDALQCPLAFGNQFFGPTNASWTLIAVMMQTASPTNGIMVAHSATGTHLDIVSIEGNSAQLYLEQNDGSAFGEEPANALAVFNQFQVVSVLCDGFSIRLYRNGTLTYDTGAAILGNFNGPPVFFEFMNNPLADVCCIMMSTGCPSIVQHNAEVSRLGVRYGITVNTVVEGFVNGVNPVPIDTTASFLTTMNWPVSDTPPTISGQQPDFALALASGATPYADYRFGSAQTGANVLTAQDIRDKFYLNYFNGNQTTAIGAPQDYSSATRTYARHYNIGDPNDLHIMQPDGLHMKAIPSQNHTNFNVMWGAMIRPPLQILPGMYLEFRVKHPPGPSSWFSIWSFTGCQFTPGPGGNPYSNFGTSQQLIWGDTNDVATGKPTRLELDYNDDYYRNLYADATPIGQNINWGAVDEGNPYTQAPHVTYSSTATGWYWIPGGGPPYMRTPINLTTGFHTIGFNWRGDGSHLMDILLDGRVFLQQYCEYENWATIFTNPKTGQTGVLPLVFNISNVPGAVFLPAPTADQDGITEGWTGIVQRIAAWHGNLANPDSLRI